MKTILFTGASSFTGYWFAKALAMTGNRLLFTLSGADGSYGGGRLERVNALKEFGTVVYDSPFGSERFLSILNGSVDVLCHHWSEVRDYKNHGFDVHAALQKNTTALTKIIKRLSNVNGAIVLTGSVFEGNEGDGDRPLKPFSPYGLSKQLTSEMFTYYAVENGVRFGKFVIPNPFGPHEELRFTSYLISQWAVGKEAILKSPEYVRDNIHASLLSRAYANFVKDVSQSEFGISKLNPSGYVESQQAFALRFGREMSERLGWKCDLQIQKQIDFSEPLVRYNTMDAVSYVKGWNEKASWDELAKYYDMRFGLKT